MPTLNTIEAPYIIADVAFQGPGSGITGFAPGLTTGDSTAVFAALASTASGQGAALVGDKRTETGALGFSLAASEQNRMLNAMTDFGATGNGTTDDSAAIQTAINALSPGQALYFPHPPAFYRIGTGLTVSTVNVTLLGESKNAGIKYTGAGVALTVTASGFNMFSLLVEGNGGAYGAGASGTHGLALVGPTSNFIIDNCLLQYFGGDGIHLSNTVSIISVSHCFIQENAGCGIASEISGSAQNGNNLSVRDTEVSSNALDGIRWKASNLCVSGCDIELNKNWGINMTWGAVASSPLPAGFSIIGNYFENNLLGQIQMAGSGGVYVNGGEISDNYMLYSDAAGGTGSATGPMGVAVSGMSFINCFGSAYYGIRNVHIGHNDYSSSEASAAFLANIAHVLGGVSSNAISTFNATCSGSTLTVTLTATSPVTPLVGQVIWMAGIQEQTIVNSVTYVSGGGVGSVWALGLSTTPGTLPSTPGFAIYYDPCVFDPTCVIEDNDGVDQHYLNLGAAKFNPVYRSRAVSGRVFQTGFTWTGQGASANAFASLPGNALFELPVQAGELINQIDVYIAANLTAYTVTMTLLVAPGKTGAAYAAVSNSGPIVHGAGGNTLNTWAGILYRLPQGYKAQLQVAITANTGGSSFVMYDPILTTN